MWESWPTYFLALVTGSVVIYVELATKYPRTQKFALLNFLALFYFVLHGVLSAILFHIILSVKDLDLVGKFLLDSPYLKAFTAGLEWQTLLRLRIFTFQTPEGKELPIGVELFWGRIANLFERKFEEKEETGLFNFLQPYNQHYQNVNITRNIALNYLGTLTLDIGEKATMRKKFEEAQTPEEVMYTFVRFRGTEVFKQRFPI